MTLAGANAYTGTTTISAGTLRIGSGGTTGSLDPTGGIVNNATLTFNRTNTLTQSSGLGNISGTGAVIQLGTGTTVLDGTNTYTGNTTVSAGVLSVTGTQTGNGTTGSGSAFVLGGTAGTSVLNLSGTISSYFQFTGATVAGANAVYNQTAGTASFTSTSTTVSSFLSNHASGFGALNITGGTTDILGRFILSRNGAATAYVGGSGTLNLKGEWGMIVYTSAGALGSLTIGPGGTVDRAGASNNFGIFMEQANQYGVFNIAGGSFVTTTRSVVFGNGGTGSSQIGFLNLAGGTFSTGVNVSQNVGTSTGQNAYINLAGGTLKATATLSNAFPGTVAGQTVTVTNFGAIDNVGTAQDFTGGITVDTNGNSVTIQNPILAATGDGVAQSSLTIVGGSGYVGAPMVQFVGGTLVAGGTPAAGYAVVSGGQVTEIVITSPGTYTVAPTVTLTGGGGTGASVTVGTLVANTSGGLTKIGNGVLTLSGTSTFTGALTISGGTVASATFNDMGISGPLGAGTGAGAIVLDGGALRFTGASPQTTDRQFTLTTNGGTLEANGTAAANTITLSDTSAITLSGAGARTLNFGGTNTGDNTFNGQIVNDGINATTVGKTGAGTWVLTNNSNSYTGGTNISAGTLAFSTANALGTTGNITFTGTSTLRWDGVTTDLSSRLVLADGVTGTVNTNGNDIAFSNAVGTSGGTTGVLNKTGTGSLTLNAAASHTGGVTLSGGTLNLGHAGALGTGTFTIATAGVVIDNTSGGPLTLSSNPGQAWNADFTFTGTHDLNMGTGAVNLSANRSVTVTANTLTVEGVIGDTTGDFGLTKLGAGTLYLNGMNTFGANDTINISAGVLKIDAESGLGDATNDVVFSNGATLQVTTGFNANAGKTFSFTAAGGGTIQVDSGTMTINSALIGTVGSTGGLIKTGAGTLALAAASTAYDPLGVGAAGATNVGFRVDAGTLLLASNSNSVVGDNNPTTMTMQMNGGNITVQSDTASIARANLWVSAAGTLTIDNLSAGPGVTQAIGTTAGQQLTMGAGASMLNITGGPNVTSGTAVAQFNNATFNVEPTFHLTNPTGAIMQLTLGAVTAGANTATFTGNGNFTQTGVWSGSGGITLGNTYSGLATLSQTNNYSGVTTVNGGILEFSAVNHLGDGSSTNDITLGGGTLRYTATGVLDLDLDRQVTLTGGTTSTVAVSQSTGNLQVTGGFNTSTVANLVKDGPGNMTVTSALNLSGGNLTVSDGSYTGGLSASGIGGLTVAAAGSLQLVDSAAVGATLTGLTLASGARLGFELGAPGTNDSLTLSGAATLSGGTITLDFYNLGGLAAGTYNLISAASGLLGGSVSYVLGNAPSGFNYVINQTDTLISLTTSILSNRYWTNSQGTGSWNTLTVDPFSNFSTDLAGLTNSGAVPTSIDTVIFSSTHASVGASPVNTTLDAAFTIDSLVFNANPAGGTFSIAPGTGGSLTLAPVSTTNGISVGNNGGAVTISAPLTAGLAGGAASQTWFVDGTGTSSLAVTGNVTFTDLVTKTGAGALTLSGTNSGAGGVTLTGGTLNINSATALGTGTFTIGAGTIINNSTAGAITLSTNNAQNWEGNFTFTGTQSLNMGTGDVALTGNTTVTTTANTLTVGGNLSDGASSYDLTKAGTGTLTVNGTANEVSGTLTVSAGTLDMNNGATNLGALTGTGGTANLNGNLTISGAVTVSGATVTMNGTNTIGSGVGVTSGTLTMNGGNTITGLLLNNGGTVNLGGANTISGGVTNSAGTLRINHANALGSQNFTINGGTIDNNTASAITNAGNNTMDWNGNFTFTGTRALNLGTGAVTLGNNITATVSGTGANGVLTVGGVIDDGVNTFNLTKAGTGTLVLSGLSSTAANNYSGTTILDGGTTTITTNAVLAGGLTFGASNTDTDLSTFNLNTGSATFAGAMLVQTNNASANTITIGDTQSLTVNGNVTIGSSAGSNTTTKLAVSGLGSFNVSNTATSGAFTVGGSTSTASVGNIAEADFSGLASMNVNLSGGSSTILVSPANTSGGSTDAVAGREAIFTLAATSVLSANTLTVGGGSTQTNSASQFNEIRLGSTSNTLNVNALNIGTGSRDYGSLTFNSGTGTVAVNGTAGASAKTALNIGTGSSTTGNGHAGLQNTFDVRGHNATLNFSTVNMGTQNRANVHNNYFGFDQGTLSMDSLTMATRTAQSTNGAGNPRTTNSTMDIGGGNVTILNGILKLGSSAGDHGSTNPAPITNAVLNISSGNVTIGATSGNAIRMGEYTATNGTTAGSANGTVNITGGTVEVNGNIIRMTNSASATATLTLNGDSALLDMKGFNIGSATTVTFNAQSGTLQNLGQVNNGAGLTKTAGAGANTLILEGTNTYTGGTTISSGVLQVGGGTIGVGSTTGTLGSGTVTNNTTLTFNRSNSYTFNDQITGTGKVIQAGSGSTILGGDNSYQGDTDINAGILQANHANALGLTGTLDFGGGTLQHSANNTVDYSARIADSSSAIKIDTNGENVTYASAIANTNTGGLTKEGTGMLTLTAGNLYTGTTTINGGTVIAAHQTALSTGDLTVASVGTLTVGDTGTRTELQISGNLSSSGTLEFDIFTYATGINSTANNDVLKLMNSGASLTSLTGTLRVTNSSLTPTASFIKNDRWTLIDWSLLSSPPTSQDPYLGLTLDLPTTLASGLDWKVFSDSAGLHILVVPEPSRALLLVLGLTLIFGRRRRSSGG